MNLFYWVCKNCAAKLHRYEMQQFGMETRFEKKCAVCDNKNICVGLGVEDVEALQHLYKNDLLNKQF